MNSGDDWIRVSHDLTFSADPLRKSRALTVVAESPLQAGLLFAGTEKGAVWVSRDDGANWIEISEGVPVKKVSSIQPSRHKPSRVYITLKGMDDDDPNSYVYRSENLGKNWTAIHAALPDEPVNYLLEDAEIRDLVFLATDRGVYLSPDAGLQWTAISGSLPASSVQKLVWAGKNRFLVAATHGMSLFHCFAEPIRNFFRESDRRDWAFLGSEPGRIPESGDFKGSYRLQTGIPVQLYWYQPDEGAVRIVIEREAGEPVHQAEVMGVEGLNRYTWDIIGEAVQDESLYPMPQYKIPSPGFYQLRIQGRGKTLRTSVRIF